jgi:hypothetical protein
MAGKRTAARAFIAAAVVGLVAAGCGGGGGARFSDRESGVSMTLPEGWRQDGNMCFESRDSDVPSGVVFVMPLEGADLEGHATKALEDQVKMSEAFKGLVDVLDQATGGAASADVAEAKQSLDTKYDAPKAVTVGARKAFESVVRTPELTSLCLFIESGSSVVEVTFRAETARWDEYEPLFRAAVDSIKIK